MVPRPVFLRWWMAARMEAGDQVARLPVNDPVGALGGMPAHVLVHTGYRSESGVGLAQDVVGTAEDLRTVAETAAPDIDEPGVDFTQVAVAHFPLVESPRPVQLGQPVGFFHQPVEDIHHLRDVVIHGQKILVGVGVGETQAGAGHGTGVVERIQVGLVERGGVPHGVTHPRHLDLDALGPQFGQVGHRVGREDIHGAAQPPDPFERCGLGVFIAHIEELLAVLLVGHLHLIHLTFALGARQVFYACYSWVFCH